MSGFGPFDDQTRFNHLKPGLVWYRIITVFKHFLSGDRHLQVYHEGGVGPVAHFIAAMWNLLRLDHSFGKGTFINDVTRSWDGRME